MSGDNKCGGGLGISRGALSGLPRRAQREANPLAVFASDPTSVIAFHDQPAGVLFVGAHSFSGRKAYWYNWLEDEIDTYDARRQL